VEAGKSPGVERSSFILSGEITQARRDRQPQRFGDYTVFEQLGYGGMATVHRAERAVGHTRQSVALKRLLPNVTCEPGVVRLFLEEARLVHQLRHPNIAECFDYGTIGEDHFIAMELVVGPTLTQLVKHCIGTVGLIPFPVALNILIQICDALAYAHDLGIIHRDVSPSNVVISPDGVVKLIDFGIAKTPSSHTAAGVIKGKLGYIAPEYQDGVALDHRADLWAVGVMAYGLLTNKRLFGSEDDAFTMRQVRSMPIEPPSARNADVPPDLDAIVLTALERDLECRWQNATALRNALAQIARPSTNEEVAEYCRWVLALPAKQAVPYRATTRIARGSVPPFKANAAAFRIDEQGALFPAPPEPPPPSPAPRPLDQTRLERPAPPRAKSKAPSLPPPIPAPQVIGAAMLSRRRKRPWLLVLALLSVAGMSAAAAFTLL
jgi:serine/threonine-protein kinase